MFAKIQARNIAQITNLEAYKFYQKKKNLEAIHQDSHVLCNPEHETSGPSRRYH